MNGDRIELTEAELDAAAAVFEVPGGMAFEGRKRYIRESIRSINRVRADDPVGTIRKPAPRSGIAVRVDNGKFKDWYVVHVNGDTALQPFNYVASWPVIYSPEEA